MSRFVALPQGRDEAGCRRPPAPAWQSGRGSPSAARSGPPCPFPFLCCGDLADGRSSPAAVTLPMVGLHRAAVTLPMVGRDAQEAKACSVCGARSVLHAASCPRSRPRTGVTSLSRREPSGPGCRACTPAPTAGDTLSVVLPRPGQGVREGLYRNRPDAPAARLLLQMPQGEPLSEPPPAAQPGLLAGDAGLLAPAVFS